MMNLMKDEGEEGHAAEGEDQDEGAENKPASASSSSLLHTYLVFASGKFLVKRPSRTIIINHIS